jgi:hypothetical protein
MRTGYLICLFLLALALSGVSQTGGAGPPSPYPHYSISSIVIDQSSKPVEGASVTVVDPETNFRTQAITNSRGQFIFPELAASTYRLQATKGTLTSSPVNVTLGPGAQHPLLPLVVK